MAAPSRDSGMVVPRSRKKLGESKGGTPCPGNHRWTRTASMDPAHRLSSLYALSRTSRFAQCHERLVPRLSQSQGTANARLRSTYVAVRSTVLPISLLVPTLTWIEASAMRKRSAILGADLKITIKSPNGNPPWRSDAPAQKAKNGRHRTKKILKSCLAGLDNLVFLTEEVALNGGR